MKRIFILLLVFSGFCLFSVTAFAGNGDIDKYNDEFSFEEMISGIDSDTLGALGDVSEKINELESSIKQTTEELSNSINELDSKIEQKQIDFMVLCYIGYGLSQNTDNPSPYFIKLLKLFIG